MAALKMNTAGEWVTVASSGINNIEVDTSLSISGKAADAKAAGDAIANMEAKIPALDNTLSNNAAAANAQAVGAAIAELESDVQNKLDKTGDTMTGKLSLQNNDLEFLNADGTVKGTFNFNSANQPLASNKILLTEDNWDDYCAPASHNHSAANITSGTLGVARGGTGITESPSMLINLASGSAASVFTASPRPGVTGTLSIGNGGTGATDAAGARTNLGAFPESDRKYINMVSSSNATAIPESANLNTDTYTNVGPYYCNQSAKAQTLTNCPTDAAFKMVVENRIGIGNNGNYRLRTIYEYRGQTYQQYITKDSGSWAYSAWILIASRSQNLITYSTVTF